MTTGMAAYRRLLRATATVFRGDVEALQESRSKIRTEFFANRDVSDPEKLKQLYADVADLDQFLRENIVQGTLNERGNYGFKLAAGQSSESCADAIRPAGAAVEDEEKAREQQAPK